MSVCPAWASSLIAFPSLSTVCTIVFVMLSWPVPGSVTANVTRYSLLSTVIPEPSVLVSFTVYFHVPAFVNFRLPKSIFPAASFFAVVWNPDSSIPSVGFSLSAVTLNSNWFAARVFPVSSFSPSRLSSPSAAYVLTKFPISYTLSSEGVIGSDQSASPGLVEILKLIT